MMIEEVTIYRCPFCKAEYQSKKSAEECMIRHKVPSKIEDWHYGKFSEYPDSITVSFGENERVALYKKERFVDVPDINFCVKNDDK